MTTPDDCSPTPRQILGAKIRAAAEAWEIKHRRKEAGGWILPEREKRDRYLARKFSLPVSEIPYFMTWSRTCTHPWSDGACPLCP